MENSITKHEFVKEIEALLNQTSACNGIVLQYGSKKDTYGGTNSDGTHFLTSRVFTPSETDLNGENKPREFVRCSWGKQDDLFAYYACIEGDSYFAIIKDVMRTVESMV